MLGDKIQYTCTLLGYIIALVCRTERHVVHPYCGGIHCNNSVNKTVYLSALCVSFASDSSVFWHIFDLSKWIDSRWYRSILTAPQKMMLFSMFILSKCCHYKGGLQGMFQSIQLCVCPVLPIAGKLCIPCESPTPFPVKVQLWAAEGFRQLNHAPDFLETFRNHFEQGLYQFEQSKSKCCKRCYLRRSTYYRWTTRQERITWNQPTWVVIRIPGTLIHQSLIL